MQINKPVVSIITPMYNVEKYIGRSIESVLNQTLPDLELILVDDCGKDNSFKIAESYAQKDSRIVIISSDHNAGPMMAREKGYLTATGKYITFLDGDDTLPENALETFLKNMEESNADIVIGAFSKKYGNQNHEEYISHKVCSGEYSNKEIYGFLLNGATRHCVCGGLYRAELFKKRKIDSFEGLKNGEDGILFYQLLRDAKKVVIIDDVVYNYWIYSTSSSHKMADEAVVRSMAFFDKYKYGVLSEELGDIDDAFNKTVFQAVVFFSTNFPYRRLMKIYQEFGVFKDKKECSLFELYSPLTAMKYFLLTRFSPIIVKHRSKNQ